MKAGIVIKYKSPIYEGTFRHQCLRYPELTVSVLPHS